MEERITRVFLPEKERRHDISKAGKFGIVCHLCKIPNNPIDIDETVAVLKRRFKEVEFHPEVDILCLTGHVITLSLMLVVAINLYREVKILVFNSKFNDYELKQLSL